MRKPASYFPAFLIITLAAGCQPKQQDGARTAQVEEPAVTQPRPDKVGYGGKGHKSEQDQRSLRPLLDNYRRSNAAGILPSKAFYLDRSLLEEVLGNNPNKCTGVRLYLAKGTPGPADDFQLVVVGTKRNPNYRPEAGRQDSLLDRIISHAPLPDEDKELLASYVVGQTGDKCPHNCDLTSPYNQ